MVREDSYRRMLGASERAGWTVLRGMLKIPPDEYSYRIEELDPRKTRRQAVIRC
jgi:hypothetical protein